MKKQDVQKITASRASQFREWIGCPVWLLALSLAALPVSLSLGQEPSPTEKPYPSPSFTEAPTPTEMSPTPDLTDTPPPTKPPTPTETILPSPSPTPSLTPNAISWSTESDMQYSQTYQLVDTLLLPIQTILGMGPVTNTIPVLGFTFTYEYTHTDMGTNVSPSGDFGWGQWLTQTYPYTSTYSPYATGSSLQKVTFADRAGMRTAGMTYGVLGDYYPETFLFGSQEYTYNTFLHHPRRPTSATAGFKIIPHEYYTESVPVTFTYYYGSAGAGGGRRSAARPGANNLKMRMNETGEIHQFEYGQGQQDSYGNEGALFPVQWLIDGQPCAKLLRLPNRLASFADNTSPVLALIRPNQPGPVFTTTYSITPKQTVFYDSILTRDPDGAPIAWGLHYTDTSYGRMLDWAAATRLPAAEFGVITETAQSYQFTFASGKLTQLREMIARSITATWEFTHTFDYIGPAGSESRRLSRMTTENSQGGDPLGVTDFWTDFPSNTSIPPSGAVRTHYYRPGENLPFLSADPYNGAIYYLRDGKGRTVGHFSTGSYSPRLFIYAYDRQGRLSAHIGLIASMSQYMAGKQMDILLTYGYDANGDLLYAWQAEPFANLYTFLYDSEAYPDIVLDSSSGGVIKRYMTYPPDRAAGGPRGFIAGAERFAQNAAVFYGVEFPLGVPPASPPIPPGKIEAFVAY